MRTSTSNDILQHVPGRFSRVASTHGGEWAGPCPWCYGTDRFRVWPYREAHEVVYWCRGCGACGDLIQFLRDAKGMSFQQACQEAGQLPRGKGKEKAFDLFKARSRSFPLEPEQLTMLSTLQLIEHRMQAALLHPRAQAYLTFRHIPLEVAQAEGMGYLPVLSEENRAAYDKDRVLRLWEDSLVTPTPSPAGRGYTARSLRLWTAGMDEEVQKAVLKQHKLPRVLKTGHAGWLWRPDELDRAVIMVEGKFEKLALVAAGMASEEVIAVGSNTANVDWLPQRVSAVLLAFNGDERGQEGAKRLAVELTYGGVRVVNCVPPDDGQGTDCSARWRLVGKEGLRYLLEAWESFQQSLPREGVHAEPAVVPESLVQPVVAELPEACADCQTSLEVDDGREFFFVEVSATTAVCYCSRCRDSLGQQRASTEEHATETGEDVPGQAMNYERFVKIAQQIASTLPGGCTVHVDPPGYTLEDRAREIQDEQVARTSMQADYWSSIRANRERPPVDAHDKPYYSREEWSSKLEELRNWRPEEAAYAHFPGGYAGYCERHSRALAWEQESAKNLASQDDSLREAS